MIEDADIVGIYHTDGHTALWIRNGQWWCSCGKEGPADAEFAQAVIEFEETGRWAFIQWTG